MAGIQAKTEALAAARFLAEAGAQQHGATLVGSDLRLFTEPVADWFEAPAGPVSPFDLGHAYESRLAPSSRRKTGTHLTPQSVAQYLIGLVPSVEATAQVLDPAVGAAAFLLAAADRLVAAGAEPINVLTQLHGVDVDPGAVAVAEAALGLWALSHGVDPQPLSQIRQGDGLLDTLPTVDLVVGNPPFLNQLRKTSSHTAERRALLRERWADLITTYTDDAWLFLAAGLDGLTPAGSLVMVQPISLLAARHARAVREHVHQLATVDALWVGRDQVFEASVQVCGVAVTRGVRPDQPVTRSVGATFDQCDALPSQPAASEWGSAGAATIGVPTILVQNRQTVGDLATATAGFREQFYGFVPYVQDLDVDAELDGDTARLVTVGMIDVLQLRWGTGSFKFAKRDVTRPTIDLDSLADGDPRLHEWTRARSRPKLLMATQTKVIELWVDEKGAAIPATPVVSVEPHDHDVESLWRLAAALSAPALSARLQALKFGTALSLNAMKVAARDVLDAPLPSDEGAWNDAAQLIRQDPLALRTFATLMGVAYRVEDSELDDWWLNRVPNRTDRARNALYT